MIEIECPECQGDGVSLNAEHGCESHPCPECHGSGFVLADIDPDTGRPVPVYDPADLIS